MNIVDVSDLAFGYENTSLFENVFFNVRSGDFAAIIGDNGAGKSTMVKLLLGLIKPLKGNINIFGQQVTDIKDFSAIGYVPQNSGALHSSFPATVKELLGNSIVIKNKKRRLKREERERKISDALNCVGLDIKEVGSKLLGDLSGGQCQRVMLARVLINSPELLILDEPTVGIDGESVDRLLSILHELNINKGVTVLLVTHDLQSVMPYINRVLCISNHSLACEVTSGVEVVHAHTDKHECHHHEHIHCAACNNNNCSNKISHIINPIEKFYKADSIMSDNLEELDHSSEEDKKR